MSDRLTEVLEGLQTRLEGDLKGNRTAVTHPGARGEAAEEDWLRVLRSHLPHRYQADRAFVIDSNGDTSEQIDIVIYDRQYSPLLYSRANQHYVPSEAVYAVLEVKQELNRENVLYAGGKAASVRRLHRTSATIHHAGGEYPPREPPPIAAGILTYQSGWTPPFGKAFQEALNALEHEAQLDIGCALLGGAFEARYARGTSVEVTCTDEACSLVEFFLRLLKRLQGLATAPAIDYDAYLARLDNQRQES